MAIIGASYFMSHMGHKMHGKKTLGHVGDDVLLSPLPKRLHLESFFQPGAISFNRSSQRQKPLGLFAELREIPVDLREVLGFRSESPPEFSRAAMIFQITDGVWLILR